MDVIFKAVFTVPEITIKNRKYAIKFDTNVNRLVKKVLLDSYIREEWHESVKFQMIEIGAKDE